MKKIFTILAVVVLTINVFAQAPQKMTYQAVVRNSSNTLVQNSPIGMKVSLLQGSATGTVVYVEKHSTSTNGNGLINIEIGGGTVVSGTYLNGIYWAGGPYFIKTEIDPLGGTAYTITPTSELLSVPYSNYSQVSGVGLELSNPSMNFLGVYSETSSSPANLYRGFIQIGYVNATKVMIDLEWDIDSVSSKFYKYKIMADVTPSILGSATITLSPTGWFPITGTGTLVGSTLTLNVSNMWGETGMLIFEKY